MSISKPFHIISMFIHSLALYRLLDLNECTGLPSSLLSLKFRLPFFQCVKNLARQGFPSTCPIGHCCVCSPLLFGSEVHLYFVIRQHTVNRGWIKWAQVGGPVAWKPKMHDDIMLNGVFSIILWLVARQLDTKPMERFMTKVKSHSACDPRVICACDKIRNFTGIIIMETLFVFLNVQL